MSQAFFRSWLFHLVIYSVAKLPKFPEPMSLYFQGNKDYIVLAKIRNKYAMNLCQAHR